MPSPNQGGSTNRQGPKVRPQGKRGPIVGKMTSPAGVQRPFRMDKGSSGVGKSGSARPVSSSSKQKSGWYLGGKKGR